MTDAEKSSTRSEHRILRALSFSRIGAIVVGALAAAALVRLFVAEPFIVEGSSMEPAYRAGAYLVIDRLSYDLRLPRRGDVVVFRYPLDPSVYLIKRIAALPGESVDEKSGALVPAQEAARSPGATSTTAITLASDEYFVLGDNADASTDSRSWGPLQRRFIVGRVFLRAWPL